VPLGFPLAVFLSLLIGALVAVLSAYCDARLRASDGEIASAASDMLRAMPALTVPFPDSSAGIVAICAAHSRHRLATIAAL
jgi:hypothetical protein